MFSSIRAKLAVVIALSAIALIALTLFALSRTMMLQSAMKDSIATMALTLQAVDATRAAQQHFKTQVQEWKNILLRGGDKASFDKHLKGLETEERLVRERLETAKGHVSTLGMASRVDYDALTKAMAEMGVNYRAALAKYDAANLGAAQIVDKLVTGMDRPPTQAMSAAVGEIVKIAGEVAARKTEEAEALRVSTRNALIGGVLAIIALLTLAMQLICRSVRADVLRLNGTAAAVAATNDLTLRAPAGGCAEIAEISRSFNLVMDRFETAIRETRSSASIVDSSAKQLAETAEELSESVERQSEETNRSAAAIEQLTVAISSVSETATEINGRATASVAASESGQVQVGNLVNELRAVEGTVSDISLSVTSFVEATGAIIQMTQQVKEIADRTNLLALNAAIEAARAGEQGRGFAVVADEVRQLAERSAKAAHEIDSLTTSINGRSTELQRAVVNGLENLQRSNTLATVVEQAIRDSRDLVTQAAAGVTEMVHSVKEEKIASTEIAKAMEKISGMSDEASSIAQMTRDTSHKLQSLAMNLMGSVSAFKTA